MYCNTVNLFLTTCCVHDPLIPKLKFTINSGLFAMPQTFFHLTNFGKSTLSDNRMLLIVAVILSSLQTTEMHRVSSVYLSSEPRLDVKLTCKL